MKWVLPVYISTKSPKNVPPFKKDEKKKKSNSSKIHIRSFPFSLPSLFIMKNQIDKKKLPIFWLFFDFIFWVVFVYENPISMQKERKKAFSRCASRKVEKVGVLLPFLHDKNLACDCIFFLIVHWQRKKNQPTSTGLSPFFMSWERTSKVIPKSQGGQKQKQNTQKPLIFVCQASKHLCVHRAKLTPFCLSFFSYVCDPKIINIIIIKKIDKKAKECSTSIFQYWRLGIESFIFCPKREKRWQRHRLVFLLFMEREPVANRYYAPHFFLEFNLGSIARV